MTASTIIGIIGAAFTILRYFVEYAQKQQWIEEGVAKVILQSLKDSDDAIKSAQDARQAIRDNNARDPASVLRDDDGFKRPGD